MGHLLGNDRLLGRLNDNCAKTEAALRVLTIRALCYTIILLLLLLLLLRDIILSFHGK